MKRGTTDESCRPASGVGATGAGIPAATPLFSGWFRLLAPATLALVALLTAACTSPSALAPRVDGSSPPTSQVPSVPQDPAIATATGNTPGNLVNGGIATGQGDWIYYMSTDGADDQGAIYRVHEDGSEKSKIVSVGFWLGLSDQPFLGLVGDWVYYAGFDSAGVFRVRADGTAKTKLVEGSITNLSIVGEWMYYGTGKSINKARTDGTDKTELASGGAAESVVVGDWIYFSQGTFNEASIPSYVVYRMRTDGTEKTEIASGQSIRHINVVGDWMYYDYAAFTSDGNLDHAGVYRMRTDGTKKTKIVNGERFGSVNVVDGWVYYSAWQYGGNNSSTIYRVRTDGSKKTRLVSGKSLDRINVVGQWIYYQDGEGALHRAHTDGSDNQAVR